MHRIPCSIIRCAIIVVVLSTLMRAQNCAGVATGLVPINDLGAQFYNGRQGGLYPGGGNTRPAAHAALGLATTTNVVPRDAAGAPSPAGLIGLVSIGMSNTNLEFADFVLQSNADPARAPAVRVVNLAQGGVDAVDMSDANHSYWTNVVPTRLANAQMAAEQVQVVWLKQAIRGSDPSVAGPFPLGADMLQARILDILNIARATFPNLRLCYLSSRIYAGYATTANSEPLAYEFGFGVKSLIAAQINGDPTLNADPAAGPVVMPWLAWGPYLWADGLTPRSDGLTWACNEFQSDGVHPGPLARSKVATALSAFFSTDPTTTPWYLASAAGLPAAMIIYGPGCGGIGGTPGIAWNSTPVLGSPNFSIGITGGPALSWAQLWVSAAPGALSLFGCTTWLDPTQVLFPSGSTTNLVSLNAGGNGFLSTAIPSDGALDQISVYLQWIVADATGPIPILGGLATTPAVEARFGQF